MNYKAGIDELMQACDNIHEESCIGCPIEYNCLRETTVEEFWNSTNDNDIEEFLKLADSIYEDYEDTETSWAVDYINAHYLEWKEEHYEEKYGRED